MFRFLNLGNLTNNWSSFADIHAKLQQIESSTDGGGTTHLSNSIKQVDVVANRAFAPLLERQVINFILKFLFSLCSLLIIYAWIYFRMRTRISVLAHKLLRRNNLGSTSMERTKHHGSK